VTSIPHPLGGKTSIAIAVMLSLLAVPYALPGLTRFRIARAPWDKTPAEVATTTTAPTSAAQLTQGGHRHQRSA